MIDKLLGIQKLDSKIVSRFNHFNATLPILLQVLQKTKANHYLLMVGNKMLETKSLKELEIGGRYFALMQHSNLGGIMLTSLKPEPKIPKGALEFAEHELKSNLFEMSKIKEMGEYALDRISSSKSKEEFLSWGFFLLGLQKKVLSFWVKEKDKKTFFQIKRKRVEIVFYALFPHLGELSGKIYRYKNEIALELRVGYESVASFLRENQKYLSGVSKLDLKVEERIAPLFLPSERLLDLKI